MEFHTIEEKVIYEKLTAGAPAAREDVSAPVAGEPSPIHLETLNTLTQKVNDCLVILEQNRQNSSFRYLQSGRKVIGRYITFMRRVIRRLVSWYVEPICQQQTMFNNAATPSVGYLVEMNTELIRDILLLSDKQQAGETALRALSAAHEETADQLARMEQALQAANDQLAEVAEVQKFGDEQLVCAHEKLERLDALNLDIFADPSPTLTFAQSGEDGIIRFIVEQLAGVRFSDVSYLDLGANHARDLSNTYHLYRLGARGVLVEANPALIPELKFYRSGDVILNRCVAARSGDVVNFYVLSGDGLSTPDKAEAEEVMRTNPDITLTKTVAVETVTVNEIIENYLGTTPMLLNIDIEGEEMAILRSIDFTRYRPLVVIVEMIPYTMPFRVTAKNQTILGFMGDNDYLEYAFTGVNSLFLDRRQLREKGRICE